MLSQTDKAKELAKVLQAISREARTAKQIAKICGCTKPTAYTRLAALREAGYLIDEEMVRDGKTGPEAKGYRLRTVETPAPVPRGQVLTVVRSRAKQRAAQAVA